MTFTNSCEVDWVRSDRYHNSFLIPNDDSLTSALASSEKHGLPPHAVSEAQGKFLNLVAKSIRARRILEIGTLGG
jgi:predicted O-methyltransferase YrrM